MAFFLATLHQPAPDGAPAGRDGRGGPLAGIAGGFAYLLEQAAGRGLIPDPGTVREI